ncbi:MAG: sugar ABC transporter permease [Chloroflexi bacterium]|nr:sugar ABC transporter permease [Chloroflexota bacterium]
MAEFRPDVPRAADRRTSAAARRRLREWLPGLLFVSPVVIGLLLFTIVPMLTSLYYSFTRYDVLSPPRWVGVDNYARLVTDPTFWTSVGVTVRYALIAVPLGLVLSGLLSLLLNQALRGISIYRALFYIPVVVPAVATAVLFSNLFNVRYGLANALLRGVGLPEYTWLTRPETALNSVIVMSLWTIGGSTIIWLAGLRSIPPYLYDAAAVDGAGRLRRIWHITIPMLTPVIFFNLVLGIIESLQMFVQVYVLTNGAPVNSTLFIMLNIFREGFTHFRMGYASAMSWVLFLAILLLTLVVFKTSGRWVYYEGDRS